MEGNKGTSKNLLCVINLATRQYLYSARLLPNGHPLSKSKYLVLITLLLKNAHPQNQYYVPSILCIPGKSKFRHGKLRKHGTASSITPRFAMMTQITASLPTSDHRTHQFNVPDCLHEIGNNPSLELLSNTKRLASPDPIKKIKECDFYLLGKVDPNYLCE